MRSLHYLCMFGLASVALCEPDGAQALDGARPASEAQAEQEPGAAVVGALVRYSEGLLTVHAAGQPLREVLADLAKEIPLTVHMRDAVKEEVDKQIVSANFDGLRLQQGLKSILKDQSFVLKKRTTGPKAEGTTIDSGDFALELWLLGGGSGGYSEPLAEHDPKPADEEFEEAEESIVDDLVDSTDEDLRDLAIEATDANTRYRAMMYLGDRPSSAENAQAFAAGLQDSDPQVRWMALGQLFSSREDVPTDIYREVVLGDPDATIRRQALEVLLHKKGYEALSVLEEVRSGANPEMSAYAEQLLKSMK